MVSTVLMINCLLISVPSIWQVKQENMTAFFTEHSPLSNHHPCSLSVENQHFTSVEQFFMKCKSSHFQDHNKVQEIMSTTNPKRAKALGRQIQNFDASSWHSVCDEYMNQLNSDRTPP